MEIKILNISKDIIGFSIERFSERNFREYIYPYILQAIKSNPKTNFLYAIHDQTIENVGTWFEDAILIIQNVSEWNKTAFLTENQQILKKIDIFKRFLKGDFKAFPELDEHSAIKWLSY